MFTEKELKLIEEALLAYGVKQEETKIYYKIDTFNEPNEKQMKQITWIIDFLENQNIPEDYLETFRRLISTLYIKYDMPPKLNMTLENAIDHLIDYVKSLKPGNIKDLLPITKEYAKKLNKAIENSKTCYCNPETEIGNSYELCKFCKPISCPCDGGTMRCDCDY